MARFLYVVSAAFFGVAIWRGLVSVDDHNKVLQVSNTQAIVSAVFSVGAFLGAVIVMIQSELDKRLSGISILGP